MKKGVFVILGLALVVIIGVTIIFYISSKPTGKPQFDYISEGVNFLKSKDYSSATQSFKKAINQNSLEVNAYLELSNIYLLKNDVNSSIDILNTGVISVSDSPSLYFQLAKSYNLAKTYDKSEENLLKLASNYIVPNDLVVGVNGELNSKDVVKLFMDTLNHEDKNDEAKKVLETYLTNSKSTDAYLNILASLLNYSTLDVAKNYYTNIVSFDDKDGIDNLHKMTTDLNSILDKTTADTKGDFSDTNKSNVARMLILFGFNTPAINILSDVLTRNPEFDQVYMLRGVAFFQKPDLPNAQNDLEKALSLGPTREETLTYLARLYDSQNNIQKAIQTYDHVLTLYPDNELNMYDYAKMLYKDELYSQSVNEYLKLIARNSPNQSTYKIELAELYIDKIANYDEVLNLTNDLVNKWSGYTSASNEIKAEISTLDTWAKYKKLLNTTPSGVDLKVVITSLQNALTLNPYNIRANFYIGQIYILNSDFTNAKTMLDNVINYDLTNEFTSEASQLIDTKIK